MLYAFIKIPGVENSESGDAYYGAAWIPLTEMELASQATDSDAAFDEAKKQRGRIKKKERLARKIEQAKAKLTALKQEFVVIHEKKSKSKDKETDESALWKTEQAIDDLNDEFDILGLRGLFGEPDPVIIDAKILKKEDDPEPSGGTLTIHKTIDSTSPKLQELCLECSNYSSDKYLDSSGDAPVELHICRQIPGEGAEATYEAYIAYIFKSCLITEIRVTASESSKLDEQLTLSFEKIYSCVHSDGKWITKGWDFIEEQPDDNATPDTPKTKTT